MGDKTAIPNPAGWHPTPINKINPSLTRPFPTEEHANIRVLIVGPADSLPPEFQALRNRYALIHGLGTEFSTISAAMDVIPLINPANPHINGFVNRWVILVTPGYYLEEVRMKPFVSIIGVDHDAVFICPPDEPLRPTTSVPVVSSPTDHARRRTFERFDMNTLGDARGYRATVYMNHCTLISNLILVKPHYSLDNDFAIWNKNTYKGVDPPADLASRGIIDVSLLGVTNVDCMPFPKREAGGVVHPKGKSILLEGAWVTAMMNNVLTSSEAPSGYDVQIIGRGQNADTHFRNCFFDSLFIEDDEGGCVVVENCHDVHIQNSLLRASPPPHWDPRNRHPEDSARFFLNPGPFPDDRDEEKLLQPDNLRSFASAVATRPGLEWIANRVQFADVLVRPERPVTKTVVSIENSTLQGGPDAHCAQILNVQPGTICLFYSSSTDSVRGRRQVCHAGLLPDVDGTGVDFRYDPLL